MYFYKLIFVIPGVITALRLIARKYLFTSFLTAVLCRNAIHFILVLYCTISASFWNVPSFRSGRIWLTDSWIMEKLPVIMLIEDFLNKNRNVNEPFLQISHSENTKSILLWDHRHTTGI